MSGNTDKEVLSLPSAINSEVSQIPELSEGVQELPAVDEDRVKVSLK